MECRIVTRGFGDMVFTLYPQYAPLTVESFVKVARSGFFDGLGSAGATLTVALYVYAKEQGEFGVAFAIAAILMVLAFLINLSATLVTKKFHRKAEG